MFYKFLRLFTSLLIVFVFLVEASKIYASSGNFTTDYHVVYTIDDKGITHANLSVILTNTSAQFYASSYQLLLGFDNITNIKAADPEGDIKTTVSKSNTGYTVTLVFNKKSIGVGSKLPFTLTFDTKSIAHHLGKLWEVDIPGVANAADFSSFTVDVKPDASFGKPSFIKPAHSGNLLTFDKSDLGKSGISIAFGNDQIYKFRLSYHLKNANLYPIKTELALPPDTNYQKVYITDINPKTDGVVLDSDGNWLAQYDLSPTQKKDVVVSGEAVVNLKPQKETISKTQITDLTENTPYWQSNDIKIKKLASDLKTPENIYNFVVKILKYDYSRTTDDKTRLGSTNALSNPTAAVCKEFTDLFIAISRSAGIPTREVDGFAYTQNSKQRPISLLKDILHAWPEYYDFKKQMWIMVDPTWGETTGGVDYFNVLDLDHLAFSIKGISDSYPLPAGGYKTDASQNTKDVYVAISDSYPDTVQHSDISVSKAGTQIAGFPIGTQINLSNIGPGSIPTQDLYIFSDNLTPKAQAFEISEIPPFGKESVNVSFDKTDILENKNASFVVQYGNKKVTKSFLISPFFMNVLWMGGVVLGLLAIALLIAALKSRSLRLFR